MNKLILTHRVIISIIIIFASIAIPKVVGLEDANHTLEIKKAVTEPKLLTEIKDYLITDNRPDIDKADVDGSKEIKVLQALYDVGKGWTTNYFIKGKIGKQIFHLTINKNHSGGFSVLDAIGPKKESDKLETIDRTIKPKTVIKGFEDAEHTSEIKKAVTKPKLLTEIKDYLIDKVGQGRPDIDKVDIDGSKEIKVLQALYSASKTWATDFYIKGKIGKQIFHVVINKNHSGDFSVVTAIGPKKESDKLLTFNYGID